MRLIHIERCLNGRIHIWLMGKKVLSYGPRPVKPYKNPKLGVSYSVWDGEELLEQSIKQIRSVADYINVVWQQMSWHGKPCNSKLESFLIKLKNKGLIDEIVFFEPDLSISPSYNEINKRNIGLRAARRAGCTHFITMDTDEFYDTDKFCDAWNDVVKRNLSYTVCNIVSYVTPIIRYRDYENLFVSFICRIDKGQRFSFAGGLTGIPCVIDPTRKMKFNNKTRFCILGNIVMHHMKHVRKDIIKKIQNSSANQSTHNEKELINQYIVKDISSGLKSGVFIKVKNKFKIKITQG